MPKGKKVRLSEYEEVFLDVRQKLPRAELHAEFQRVFDRPEVTLGVIKALYRRRGWRTGRTGRFEKGAEPWSKGKRLGPDHGGKDTRFKKGNVPHTFKGGGHEYVDRQSGYVFLILDEPNPWKPEQKTRPVLKHKHLWEQANGAVPEGHVLKCLDGNKQNTDPSNWEPVAKAMIPRLAGRADRGLLGYDEAPAELKPTLLAIAKLEHKARTVRREREESSDA